MAARRIEPGPGQESVWDYPRPPALEKVTKRLRVVFNGVTIADTEAGYAIKETSHPPTYYFPPADVKQDHLEPAAGRTLCEFKGQAKYFDVVVGDRRAERALWCYPSPSARYAEIAGCYCFYPSKVDACYVGDERVAPQEGDFYGGWITSDIIGPFKGGTGTMGW